MNMSELLKEAKLTQYDLEFCGMGLLPIVLHTDADRKFNASDMLTHSPSAEELRKFLPMIGCHTMGSEEGELQCSRDDAERDACSKGDCISCDLGGNFETMSSSSESFHRC